MYICIRLWFWHDGKGYQHKSMVVTCQKELFPLAGAIILQLRESKTKKVTETWRDFIMNVTISTLPETLLG